MGAAGFYVAGMGALLASLATEFSRDPATLSWVGSTFGVGLVVVAALGPLVLRRGPRPALTVSAAALAAGALLVSLAPSLELIFVGTLIQGLAAAVMVLVAPIMLAVNADIRLARVNGASSLVGIGAPLLVGAAVAIGVAGRLAMLLLVPIVGWLAWSVSRSPNPTAASSRPENDTARSTQTKASRWSVLRRWLVLVLSVSVEFCFVVWGVSRLRATGLSTGLAAVFGIAFPIGMALGRLAARWLIEHLPPVLSGVAVGIGATLLVVLADSAPLVALGLMLAGAGVSLLYPVTLARLMAVPGLKPAHGASLGALAAGTAVIVAPTALAAMASGIELRLAFALPIPLLVVLLLLHGHQRAQRAD